jgi:autotransporter-associated beta strand protein
VLSLFVVAFAALNAAAVNLQWDAAPATAGVQDGAGNWSNLGSLNNWWDGTQNVAWTPGATAVIGLNLTAAATITLTNPIVAGGIIFSNIPVTGTATYTLASGSGGSVGSISLTGTPASIVSAVNYPAAGIGVGANETISASVVATGGLQLTAMTPWQAQVSFNNTSNYIVGTMEVGTSGNASYTTPTAMQGQFNSAGIGANALNGCNTMIIHSNASVLFRGGSGAFTLNWPKKFIVSGDGIPSSSFCFGALSFSGNTGTIFPADIQLAGDSTVVGVWGVNNVIFTNTGSISGTGRLRFCSSANRPTSGTIIFKGKHTYVGDTIFDGTITVQLASGLDDRLPTGTSLKLGTTGVFYAPGTTGIPQSSYNGYGRLVLGDALGAVNQTLASLTNDSTLNTTCWVIGGNANTNSVLTINNANDSIYNARLGGASSPDKMLGLIKTGAGTLYLQGTNLCAGGYTISSGALVIGDGNTDNPLGGPVTNNAALTINVGNSLAYADAITGNGVLTKGGYGTLTLTGTNLATGPLVVQLGTLVLNPTLAGNESLVVASGASLQINRPALTASVPGVSASFDSASVNLDLDFNLTGPTATAPLNLSDALTNNGNTLITITRWGALSVGSFPLIKYGSYQSNDFSAFTVSSFVQGITPTIQNNPANHSIDLVISQITGNTVKWTGATDNNWDTGTINWFNTSSQSPVAYSIGDFALFDDTATGPTALLLGSDPQPNSLTISNVTKAYSFSGAGIGGPATLVKRGTGTLTVVNNNNNTGGTQIQGGTVQVGDGATDGAITAPILDNGALVFNVASSSAATDISGTGSLSKSGPGQLTLGGNSAYQGATAVQQGTLYVQSSTALGAATNGTTVQAGAELWVDATDLSIAEPLVLSGAGINGAGGALNASANAVASTWSGPITVTSNATLLTATATTLTLSGQINAGANSLVLQPNGSATINIASNLTAASVALNASGNVRLYASNNLSHAAVLLPAALYAFHSQALGLNATVGLTNALTPGGPVANLVLASNVTIPASVSLAAEAPAGAANAYRTALSFGVGPNETNTWNGPITLSGPDAFSSGLPSYFIVSLLNGQAVINGNITMPPGQTANIQFRGGGISGVINGRINLDTNNFTRTDSALWTIASTGNTWGQTWIFNGRLLLGANEAMPASALLRMDNSTCILDLNGFSQHVPELTNSGNTAYGSIVNSSSNSASTLLYQGGDSFFGGTISATAGAQPLHLDMSSGSLTLSNINTYTGTTTIRNGATLAFSANGSLTGTSLIDLQAGGTLDLSGSTGGFAIGANQTFKGNGTVSGNLTVAGNLSPGESIGTLNVLGNVTLSGSAITAMEVNNSTATADLLNVGGTLSYAGTLLINNVSATPYVANQIIKVFNAGGYGGFFSSIIIPGVTTYDASKLIVDGTIKVLTLVSTAPTTITASVTGGTALTLSWPADHTTWRLLVQTNKLSQGLSVNPLDWGSVAGSQSTNEVTIAIDTAKPTEFYRLVYP